METDGDGGATATEGGDGGPLLTAEYDDVVAACLSELEEVAGEQRVAQVGCVGGEVKAGVVVAGRGEGHLHRKSPFGEFFSKVIVYR